MSFHIGDMYVRWGSPIHSMQVPESTVLHERRIKFLKKLEVPSVEKSNVTIHLWGYLLEQQATHRPSPSKAYTNYFET